MIKSNPDISVLVLTESFVIPVIFVLIIIILLIMLAIIFRWSNFIRSFRRTETTLEFPIRIIWSHLLHSSTTSTSTRSSHQKLINFRRLSLRTDSTVSLWSAGTITSELEAVAAV